ncbi:hypothetical protein ASE11_14315 [Hydrogenophaga sp. Root209]|uniref:hypothetical protein n=1 Tax=Hydrogenophaga sp. Root209 TaxID=1736490 RepID=UPI0006F87E52|nr:hypothetical protein [Hydrogenophaga sp. Root209]KRB97984.1 hypothetical protein ASE11_14315 [Hydrogenophaga sp. Root209]
MKLPTTLPAWQELQTLAGNPTPHLRELLADPHRAQRMSATAAGITLDTSRQRLTPAIQHALLELAEQSDVAAQRDAMFRGDTINTTEDRPVLHVALRGDPLHAGPWGNAVQGDVHRELARVCEFAQALTAGAVLGFSGEAITDVVNIGIGGSDLGPRMAIDWPPPPCPASACTASPTRTPGLCGACCAGSMPDAPSSWSPARLSPPRKR